MSVYALSTLDWWHYVTQVCTRWSIIGARSDEQHVDAWSVREKQVVFCGAVGVARRAGEHCPMTKARMLCTPAFAPIIEQDLKKNKRPRKVFAHESHM